MAEDEMAGWRHQLDGPGSEGTLLHAMRQLGRERSLGESGYTYVND